jgi:hypothetical protein
MAHSHSNLLGGPEPTFLPIDHPDTEVAARLAAGETATALAAALPSSSLAWALLADNAFERGADVESYAYARVGYHRGLDALRRAGWKGHGPVPFSHVPNQGFLRALNALGRAAAAVEEEQEAARCRDLLADCDPDAAAQLA